jgi:hypothetical protein
MNIPFRQHAGYDPLGDCGKGRCPICARNNAIIKVKSTLKSTNFQSQSVAPFVGRIGYPNINVGILAPPQPEEEAWLYDAPKYWAYKQFQIHQIVDFRSSLLNSRSAIHIKSRPKLLELSQEVSMASKPTDVDITLEKVPSFRLMVDSHAAPTGPAAALKQAKLTSNPSIHTKMQKVFDDTDLKAQNALVYLYENNFDENFLSRIMSVGVVGMKKNRKLVPTRWSITATDDILGKNIIDEIRTYQQCHYAAHFGGYLGNYYIILFFPEVWGYELFETYTPSFHHFSQPLRYTTDYETYDGRKEYASETVGGYYTVRLAILEKLQKMRRQGMVLALRFITDEYTMPLGVWVTREAARKALEGKGIEFSSKELMLDYAKKLVRKKFNADASWLLNNSVLLKTITTQKKLAMYA